MVRFVRRLWRVVHDVAANAPTGDPGDGTLTRKAHETIQRVTDDLDRRMQFHTPISTVISS
jgi:leucyl-tRNA synthetase